MKINCRSYTDNLTGSIERILLDAAVTLNPTDLAALAERVRLATGADETAEAAGERRYASRWLALNPTFGGMLAISGMLDPELAEKLLAALTPLAEPAGEQDHRSAGQRRADALGEIVDHALACGVPPESGGEPAHLYATIDYRTLLDELTDAEITLPLSGLRLSAGAIRRLACDAKILPAVLDGRSAVLDLADTGGTWTLAVRRAARLRDQHCTFPGCHVPLNRCQLHHLQFKSRGGTDTLTNATHLCRFHHWLVHHREWTLRRDPTGTLVATGPWGQQLRAPP